MVSFEGIMRFLPRLKKVKVMAGFLVMLALVSVSAFSMKAGVNDFIDSALLNRPGEEISVIVTGVDSTRARAAVELVGGNITSDLWLVDAVGATISSQQLARLAAQPGVISIVNNYEVETSDDRTGSDDRDRGYGNAANGFATSRRLVKGTFLQPENQTAPTAFLPDGGLVAIDEKGNLTIVNADGSSRANLKLTAGSPFKYAPSIGAGGAIFIVGEGKRVFAIEPNGQLRWMFSDASESFKGSAVLSVDERIVYITDQKQKVYALDSSTGRKLWHFRSDRADGDVKTTPARGSDGVLYILTEKGYLVAIAADGTPKWVFRASGGGSYLQSPQLTRNGLVLITGEDKLVTAVRTTDGSPLYRYGTESKVLAQPAVAGDGSVYIASEERTLHGLNPNGTVRFKFRPPSGKFKTSPLLSLDGKTVYAAVEDGILYAVDTQSGNLLWQYFAGGKVYAGASIDGTGQILLGNEYGQIVALESDGSVKYRTAVPGEIKQPIRVNPDGSFSVLAGDKTLAMMGLLPRAWDGRDDVRPSESKKRWKLVNPVAVDIGADVLHDGMVQSTSITGQGVTIAVVDSGVFFTQEIKNELGSQVAKNFVGQADFVRPICPIGVQKNGLQQVIGQQFDSYCFHDFLNSQDDYGHGSHVAGIIWNNMADYDTGVAMGIAPGAQILSVRVLGADGRGTYESTIKGIQYIVANKERFNIRVVNLSLSGHAAVPYFADPLNRAVEKAWAKGLVVIAAAGNSGPDAQSITVPGNDPYIITVGAIDSKRTPGYWYDDVIPDWSAAGPTLDGFVKPDILAPGSQIVSFMYNDGNHDSATSQSAALVLQHPDYSESTSLFRMNGTSMATAVTSGVVALMLQANPMLTPDQIKYHLMVTAVPAVVNDGQLAYSPLRQGAGRIWAPAAVLSALKPSTGRANGNMDILSDLSHDWVLRDENGRPRFQEDGTPIFDPGQLAYHYFGPVRRVASDDGRFHLYYVENRTEERLVLLGGVDLEKKQWVDDRTLRSRDLTFNRAGVEQTPWAYADAWAGGTYNWSGGTYNWSGGTYNWSGGTYNWSGGTYNWSGGTYNWSGGTYNWSGGTYNWSGGTYNWSGGTYNWSGGTYNWSGGTYNWSGGAQNWTGLSGVSATTWIDE